MTLQIVQIVFAIGIVAAFASLQFVLCTRRILGTL